MNAIGIVASTGGPQALREVLSGLSASFRVPVLIAQHLLDGTAAVLARSLAGRISMAVRIAAHGDLLLPAVYLAPDGCDLELDRNGRLGVQKSRGWAHSGDRLLHSVADVCGPSGCGVVLSGLGDDGAAGLASVKAAGGLTVCQDPNDAVANSMPVAARGAAQRVVTAHEISTLLLERFGALT